MILMIEFCDQMGYNPFGMRANMELKCSELENAVVRDNSEFVVVDGEEGDHGIIKFFSKKDNAMLAVQTVNGGDDEWVEFTKAGFDFFKPHFEEIIKNHLATFRTQCKDTH